MNTIKELSLSIDSMEIHKSAFSGNRGISESFLNRSKSMNRIGTTWRMVLFVDDDDDVDDDIFVESLIRQVLLL
jgi:hypothetical protein